MSDTVFLEGLNDRQAEAVRSIDGPLLILAGAGSGKTRVLTHRAGYLLEQGADPWSILCITFTNKAAGEMRERVDQLIPGIGESIFVSTFHSMCVRMLRRDIERLGFSRDFTIYDTDDQRTLMKHVIKALELDPKMYRERAILGIISSMKNEMVDEKGYEDQAADYYERNVSSCYREYQKRLKANNALDFDDLLVMTVRLFDENPEVLSYWQNRFRYIMVDEYQDTNTVQFELVRRLSALHKNLCVVGDDDQSIYKFRGANIENILSFEKSFPGARVIKLEQNYRSTSGILNTANEVIKNNKGRKPKRLWTEAGEGEKPVYTEYETAGAEADAVVRAAADGRFSLKDQAVLYRTNAQSRLLEEKCIARNVPYTIVGGVNFYQRKEIKDILAYLRIIANGVDDLSCQRVLNVPKRGIGDTSVGRITAYASINGKSFFDALSSARLAGVASGTAAKIDGFVSFIEGLRARAEAGLGLKELIEAVRDESGYREELEKEGPIEAETRMQNIEELVNKAVSFEEDDAEEDKSLAAFLENVSLVADIDRASDTDNKLTLMTLHAAKGLEFDRVFLCGLEEGLFPSSMSINSETPEDEIEEERRLCYVGITRAKKVLVLSSAAERMVNGETRYAKPSRFVDEMPDDLVIKNLRRRKAASWEDADDDYDNPIPRRGFSKDNEFARKFGGFGPAGGGLYGSRAGGAGGSFGSAYGSRGQYGSGGAGSGFGSLDLTRNGKTPAGLSALKKGIQPDAGGAPDYGVGDRVSHIKFGEGTVLSLEKGARDYEVTVDFDTAGTKRMFAGFAKLKKL